MDNLLINSRIEKLKSLGFLGYSLYIDGTLTLPEMSNTIIDIKRLLSAPGNGFHTTYVVNEAAVNEKLTELGCVCYNLYVDKRINNVNVELTSLCELISSINRQIYVQPQVAEPLPLTVATSSTAEEIAPTMAESMTAEEIAPTMAESMTAEEIAPTMAESMTAEEIAPTAAESMTAEEITPTAAEPMTAEEIAPTAAEPMTAEEIAPTAAEPVTTEEIAPTMAESMTAEEIAPTAAEPVTAPAQCPPGFELIPTNPKICLCGYKNSQRANFCGKCGLKL